MTFIGGGTRLKSLDSGMPGITSTLSSGAIPGIMGIWLESSPVAMSSASFADAGKVFKLYLSLIESPGRFRVQNLQL